MPLVKLVILGAPGVGKTSLIESFLGHSNCSETTATLPAPASSTSTTSSARVVTGSHPSSSGRGEYQQSQQHAGIGSHQIQKHRTPRGIYVKQHQASRREHLGPPGAQPGPSLQQEPPVRVYRFSVMIDTLLVHVKVLDMPCISYFPNTAYHEWSDFRSCALRSANGYLLVFDLSAPGTFQYVKVIRDQLYESRNMHHVPVFIVGNKADLCSSILSAIRSSHGHHHHHLPHLHVGRPFRLNILQSSSSSGASAVEHQRQHHQTAAGLAHHHHHLHVFHHHHHHEDFTPALKDVAAMIKKHWRGTYIECSAKFNWRVYAIFKEMFKQLHNQILLMESSEASAAAEPMTKPTSSKSMESLQHAAQETVDSLKTLTIGSKSGGGLQATGSSSAAPGGASAATAAGSGAHQRHSTSNQENPSSSCVLL